MTISAEWAGIILTLIVAICGVLGWLLSELKKDIQELKDAFTQDFSAQGIHIQRLDDRLRQHTENEDRHTSATARLEYQQRLRRIEDLLEKLLFKT